MEVMKLLTALCTILVTVCVAPVARSEPTPVTAIVTEPDSGTTDHRTIRWDGPVVTYTLAGTWPAGYLVEIHDAFAFAAHHPRVAGIATTDPYRY